MKFLDLNSKIFFPGQQAGEKIHLVTRRHWMVLAKEVLGWLVFVAILMLFDAYVAPKFPSLAEPPWLPVVNLLKTVYLMFLMAAVFMMGVLYYLNYQIVTNERIVDVDQRGLLHHSTSELHLNRLQDVTAEVKGVLGTFFNFGNVYIQTAGEASRFEFDNVPNPHEVAKLILDLYEQLPPEEKAVTV